MKYFSRPKGSLNTNNLLFVSFKEQPVEEGSTEESGNDTLSILSNLKDALTNVF